MTATWRPVDARIDNRTQESGRRADEHEAASAAPLVISLLDPVPAFAAAIPAEDQDVGGRALVARLLSAKNDDLGGALTSQPDDAFDFLLVEGIVFKETTLSSRSALELLGAGDILAPPLSASRQLESRAVGRYLAHGKVALAVFDDRFRQATRRWPGLADVLHDLLARQTHRASVHVAMLHLPHIEDRILALFSDLAERYGRMTPDGAVVDFDVSHDIIGRLVASRRPTVSIALQRLATDGQLSRREDARWLLNPRAMAP